MKIITKQCLLVTGDAKMFTRVCAVLFALLEVH